MRRLTLRRFAPPDVLLGGGAADKKRILHVWNTSAKVSATISNLTVTGAYTTTDAAGIYGSQYLVLRDLVISNNVANGLGAGCLRGKAYNCLFANNTATGKDGGGYWSDKEGNGAWNCIFTNNVAPSNREGGGLFCSGANSEVVGCRRFLYPPRACFDKGDGPILEPPNGSMRLEILRDGIEDYEYFAILSRLDPGNALLEVPADVSKSQTDFTRRPAPIKAHRLKLAREIERLSNGG